MEKKELVIVGEEEIGKTTLANALLGWDIFPQTNDGWYFPTKENTGRMLTDKIKLTDTPGYDLWRYQVPEAVTEAVSRADTVIMMFTGFGSEEDVDMDEADPELAEEIRRWLEDLEKEDKLLQNLLAKANTRDIYFVLPFSGDDGPLEGEVLARDLARAKARFAAFSDHGEAGFFCIDPWMALVAAIEDDPDALARSGILALKEALFREV